jgi:Predicted solute binding protein
VVNAPTPTPTIEPTPTPTPKPTSKPTPTSTPTPTPTVIPTLPTISMPGSVNSGSNITATWNSISGAKGYTVALLDQTAYKKIINDTLINSKSYTISSKLLTSGHSYKFWVGVTNAGGTNAGSYVCFTVGAVTS